MPARMANRLLAAPSMAAEVKNCTEAPTTGTDAVASEGATAGTRALMVSVTVRGMSSASMEKVRKVAEDTAR